MYGNFTGQVGETEAESRARSVREAEAARVAAEREAKTAAAVAAAVAEAEAAAAQLEAVTGELSSIAAPESWVESVSAIMTGDNKTRLAAGGLLVVGIGLIIWVSR
jgi:uncharacterized protein YjeT (DUF2065 family)